MEHDLKKIKAVEKAIQDFFLFHREPGPDPLEIRLKRDPYARRLFAGRILEALATKTKKERKENETRPEKKGSHREINRLLFPNLQS